jgi:hypothetical protein
MQDEPEVRPDFSRKMSPRRRKTAMLGVADHNEAVGQVELGGDPGVFGSDQGGAVSSP